MCSNSIPSSCFVHSSIFANQKVISNIIPTCRLKNEMVIFFCKRNRCHGYFINVTNNIIHYHILCSVLTTICRFSLFLWPLYCRPFFDFCILLKQAKSISLTQIYDPSLYWLGTDTSITNGWVLKIGFMGQDLPF